MKNIAYAGALIAILDVDMEIVEQLLDEKFSAKKALRESNPDGAAAGLRLRQRTFRAAFRSVWKRWTRTATRF